MIKKPVEIYAGEELAAYGFPEGHPFSLDRHDAFLNEFKSDPLFKDIPICQPVSTDIETLTLFHTPEYVEMVKRKSDIGIGYLDSGDTPAFPGVFEAASFVVGTVLHALDRIMSGSIHKAFVPIAGLHHARRDRASGFCVFNDCGVAIEYLFKRYNLASIAYVDIDAHHADGVFYGFLSDPRVIFADVHESGKYLFPGTGFSSEVGKGDAKGKKLNIEMEPDSTHEDFLKVWPSVMSFLEAHSPELIIFQCGADSINNDPLTHMKFSTDTHTMAARDLANFSNLHCHGKMLAVGGGGYNLSNISKAWCGVVKSMLKSELNTNELSDTSV